MDGWNERMIGRGRWKEIEKMIECVDEGRKDNIDGERRRK